MNKMEKMLVGKKSALPHLPVKRVFDRRAKTREAVETQFPLRQNPAFADGSFTSNFNTGVQGDYQQSVSTGSRYRYIGELAGTGTTDRYQSTNEKQTAHTRYNGVKVTLYARGEPVAVHCWKKAYAFFQREFSQSENSPEVIPNKSCDVPIASASISYEKSVEQRGGQTIFDLNSTDYELKTELKTNSDYNVTVPTSFGVSVEINFSKLVDVANKVVEEIKNAFK